MDIILTGILNFSATGGLRTPLGIVCLEIKAYGLKNKSPKLHKLTRTCSGSSYTLISFIHSVTTSVFSDESITWRSGYCKSAHTAVIMTCNLPTAYFYLNCGTTRSACLLPGVSAVEIAWSVQKPCWSTSRGILCNMNLWVWALPNVMTKISSFNGYIHEYLMVTEYK